MHTLSRSLHITDAFDGHNGRFCQTTARDLKVSMGTDILLEVECQVSARYVPPVVWSSLLGLEAAALQATLTFLSRWCACLRNRPRIELGRG